MASAGLIAGVDVGGTFTDLVMLDPETGAVRLAKVPSTLGNQAYGVLAALEAAGGEPGRTGLIVHGTTTTTNAVLERKLSRTGMITTAGFRDILELGRRTRPHAYGMTGEFRPVIPRDLRLEVAERMDAQGRIVTPLDEAQVTQAAQRLLDAGCEAVVIHFLHAYANPGHELRAGEIVRALWPNPYVTLGHALLSEAREFERGVTAAVNASVQPLLDRYVSRLADELQGRGHRGQLLIMNGNGGMVAARLAAAEAAKTVMSGPASGVMAAAHTGKRAGIGNLITYDMGGTSTDVALIRDCTPSVSSETEIEYAMPIHVPMVDVRTVGAGGGSIAHVNAAGLLDVGPQSAGAEPGPVCYGRGGLLPTISDANYLLGRLEPAGFAGGRQTVSRAQVAAVFEAEIGARLGLDAATAAAAVIRIANAKMAGAIRMVSVSLGADPRDFTLFAFGGAGPLHAMSLAAELGVPRVLIPARPGITNALGCAVADLRHDFVNTVNRPLDLADIETVHDLFAKQAADGERLLASQGVSLKAVRHLLSVDMQFIGQTHLLRVNLLDAKPSREELRALFEEVYFARFKVKLPEIRANLVNVNTSVIGEREPVSLAALIDPAGRATTLEAAMTGMRRVWFETGWAETPVYDRERLPMDAAFSGPAVLEQMDCTTLIGPGDKVQTDDDGNLIVSVAGAA
ncbi:MAG: hydantoinase/oxoprolinase family protein [Rhizobiaceae bacterium]